MIDTKIGYSYNDLTIIPAVTSVVSSRSQVNPFCDMGYLPIFTAPMSTIVNIENLKEWGQNNIKAIVPRNIDISKRIELIKCGWWVALSMKEAKELFIDNDFYNTVIPYICIDVANGHMQSLIDLCKKIKIKYGYDGIKIMTGNIANPYTLIDYDNAGIDYVRCSIGGGSGCLTTPQTATHYPIASLIDECVRLKKSMGLKINIVADGGIRNYGDVIKALALGADFVMIGSVFASLYESAAEMVDTDSFPAQTDEETKRNLIKHYNIKKRFYGMSTKKAQKLIKPDSETLKTSEGLEKLLDCTHTMKQWSENMEAYLRSAMSYCSCFTLQEFIGNQVLKVNSPAEIQAVNK